MRRTSHAAVEETYNRRRRDTVVFQKLLPKDDQRLFEVTGSWQALLRFSQARPGWS